MRPHYSPSNRSNSGYLSQQDLFAEIGWDEFVGNPNYHNTCAIRVSLALAKAGRAVSPGSHRILKGPHQGKRLEVNMRRLASLLATPAWLGTPETLAGPRPANGVRGRPGIIAFHGIPGFSGGGHIDLIAAAEGCASDCYFNSREVWFWPLPLSRPAGLRNARV